MDEHPCFESEYGDYVWCLHCEKVFKKEKWIQSKWHCPDKECNGSPLDAWEWSLVQSNNTGYPDVPVEGKCYRLYGE